ncbi:uncharacterized protein EKO05_0010244 [Ascochyta rabiei]|uniref:uncharacterized protein n=1 Tax=Didymella rabiei TaxID=5454 RepID=UPI0019012A1D|nr:uncharacterized protein EKO05_0010244 [Ascochyta rabiei]UPX19997.1 hypothetical protein EKO05_0010244 [Ascochyta rabiei]
MDNILAASQSWPDQRLRIMIPTWTLLIISTVFLVWRGVYGVVQKRRFMASDYLLIIAAALNIIAQSMSQVQIEAGLGRHFMDPSVLPNLMRFAYYLWIAQIINIMAVAFIKWSICAYLLVLNFSKFYHTS